MRAEIAHLIIYNAPRGLISHSLRGSNVLKSRIFIGIYQRNFPLIKRTVTIISRGPGVKRTGCS